MSLNSKFDNAFQKLKEEKEKIIIDKNLIPVSFPTDSGVQTITADSLNEQFSKAKSEPFTIAVCGDVKAGKSTFLNAIIFGKNVLPTFETPSTAKLTFIKKTDKNNSYFKANFYSKEEWDNVKNDLKENFKDVYKALEKNTELTATRNGIYECDCIEDTPKSVIVNEDLEKLNEYVSAIDEYDDESCAGKFTPYVKNVEIFIDDERLNDLQIVDTPGLNDPNLINSRETSDWINNAHAIIYIAKGKGFDMPDFKFFQQFLSARGPKYRIIVQNQIDDMNDYEESLLNMKKLGSKPEYKECNLFSPEETVCSYSGLQILIKKKENQGIPLTDDDEFYKKDGDFDPHQLEKKISEKLFCNEGFSRIETIYNDLNRVYEINYLKIESEIDSNESMIEDFETDKKDLEEKKQKLDDQKREFGDKLSSLKYDKIDPYLVDISEKMNQRIAEDMSIIKDRFNERIKEKMAEGNFKTVRSQFPSIWTDELTKENNSLIQWMNGRLRKFNEILREVSEQLRSELLYILNKKYISKFYPPQKEGWDIPQDIENSLNFGKVFPRNVITNLFHINSNLNNEIYGVVEKNLNEHYYKIIKDLPNKFEAALEKRRKSFFDYIEEQLKGLKKQLEESINNYDNKENEICKLKDKIKEFRENQILLKQKQMELKMVMDICK